MLRLLSPPEASVPQPETTASPGNWAPASGRQTGLMLGWSVRDTASVSSRTAMSFCRVKLSYWGCWMMAATPIVKASASNSSSREVSPSLSYRVQPAIKVGNQVCNYSWNLSSVAQMPKRHNERQEMPLVGNFRCLQLCRYGMRELAYHHDDLNQSEHSISTNERWAWCLCLTNRSEGDWPSVQWAAVTTYLSPTRLPPQPCLKYF